MAKGKGQRKWKRRARRARARARHPRRKLLPNATKMPPCSCCKGKSTHIIRKGDGTFFASCDADLQEMVLAMRLQGIDAQVISMAALAQMNKQGLEPGVEAGSVPSPARAIEHEDGKRIDPERELTPELRETMNAAQDEILANTILPDGRKYRDVHGDPPYAPLTLEECEAVTTALQEQTAELYAADHGDA